MISLSTFGMVLLKLVFDDLWAMPTIGKIIVFIILGLILLILSFLYQKLKDILESAEIDQQRIVTEAAIFADKVAVDEETVRLKSHISQLDELLESDGAIGRKLDFIVQEMNREVNTIGSKAQDIEITKLVVEMKSEIEKIREQIQNIE